ncbi:MAG: hypothetical protein R3272_00815 [Candidatus Promineifilaceae bacterium]|nr:hypothetical protein [Candidatus Promineifilaceae bacterium]
MTAYTITLAIHSVLRWVVLLAGVGAVILAFYGWLQKQERTGIDNMLSLLFTLSLDVQFLIGLFLYLFLSPLTTSAFADFGRAMADAELRFFLVEHGFAMFVALVLAHIGRARAKRQESPVAAHRLTAIFFTLALLLVIISIPWASRPLFRF